MAGGMDVGQGGGKGGKKPLDTAINLVPFIDLMAVTISFLIMTAVWTQIGRLQVAQSGGEAAPEEQEKPQLTLTLLVTEKGLTLNANGASFEVPYAEGKVGKVELGKLAERIKEIKTQFPDHSTITLQTEDAVRYEDLVRIIDECIGAGLPNVSVAAAMG